MGTKKNNHLLPRMVIKRWEEHNGKIYDKESKTSREVEQLDYSKEYYYSLGKVDDELENRISLFEAYIGKILKQLNEATDEITLSEKDMEILKLYVVLQSCRNDNTSPYIIDDESGFYQNNRYLFGVAATLFLEFLNKNKRLVKDGKLVISNNTLVAITLLTAESKPNEMEIIINVIMHLLSDNNE